MQPTLYRVYVDETGDRGWGGRTSPIFAVSAVIVEDGREQDLVAALDRINAALRKPPGTVLHWAENIKQHSQRKFVARTVAELDMTITSVVVFKQPMMGSGTGLSDPAQMYNYAVRRLLERISWFVGDRGGKASVTFAHIKRFPYWRLRSYVALLKSMRTEIRWHVFTGNPKNGHPDQVRQLQVADLVAGAHGSAFRPDDFGAYESSYLYGLIPRIYIRGTAKVTSYGLNIVGPPTYLAAFPWWPDFLARCEARTRR